MGQTSNAEGKEKAIECNVSSEEPTIIPLGDGFIVGITMCTSEEVSLESEKGIVRMNRMALFMHWKTTKKKMPEEILGWGFKVLAHVRVEFFVGCNKFVVKKRDTGICKI